MSDVYRIQTSLQITGNVTRELRAILGSMEKVEGHAKGVKTHIDSWGGAIRTVLNDVRSLSRAMSRLGGNSRKVSPLQSLMGFSAADATREMNELARAMGRIGRGGRRGPMANPLGFNAAEVAAEVTKMNEALRGIRGGNAGASRSFGSWAGSLERSATAAERLERALAGVRTHAPGGSPVRLPGGGGGRAPGSGGSGRRGHRNHIADEEARAVGGFVGFGGGAHLAKDVVETGVDMRHIELGMRQTGATDAQVSRARDAAYAGSRQFPNLAPVEIFEHINDLRGILGTMDKAIDEAPHILEEFSALKAKMGSHGSKNAVREIYSAVKSAETANEITPEGVKEHVNQLMRMSFWYGDKLNPSNYFSAQKSAGQMLNLTSDDFRHGAFAALAQEIGPRAGTQVGTFMPKAAAGLRMTGRGLTHAFEMGLLDNNTVEWSNQHLVKQGAQFKDWKLAASDPDKFLYDKILPAFAASGKVDMKSDADVLKHLGIIFSDKNAYGLLFELYKQRTKIQKDREGVLGTSGNTAAYRENDPYAALQGTQAQAKGVGTAISEPAVPQIVAALNDLNKTMGELATFFKNSPTAAKGAFAIGGAAIGGTAAVGLTQLAIASAGVVSLPALAIGTIAAVTIGSFFFPWDEFRKKLGFDSREKSLNDAVDPNLKSALDLEKQAKEAQKGVAEGSKAITEQAPPTKSWLERLSDAISRMGLAAMMAESGVQKMSLSISGLAGALGGGGSGIQKANFTPGGGGSLGAGIGGAGRGGGNGIVPPGITGSDANMLGLISKYESGGRNVMNYIGDRTHTAQGYYQITNSNWRKIAPRLGITAPNAMSASLADQARVAQHLLHNGKGIRNWSDYNPKLRGALRRGETYQAPKPTTAPPPPPKKQELVAHLHAHLDGQKIAMNTTRHQFRSGNRPATGANVADHSELYPVVG